MTLQKESGSDTTLSFQELITTLLQPLTTSISVSHGRTKSEIKSTIVLNFIKEWKSKTEINIYPAFRLLLPDKDTRQYKIKETNLAKLILKIWGIPQDSIDAKKLMDKKNGHFMERCEPIIMKRNFNEKYSNLSIKNINDDLDELSLCLEQSDQLTIFKNWSKNLNGKELYWLFKIILKQLNLGISEKTVLSIYHPDALQLFSISQDLNRVCDELQDVNVRLNEKEQKIQINSCFQPMTASSFGKYGSFDAVAEQMKKNWDPVVAAQKEQQSQSTSNTSTNEYGTFYIEEKMDGERIQLHMFNSGKSFKFFSRNNHDYTSSYGSTIDAPSPALTRHLKNAFHPKVNNCILDGEMVAYDPNTNKIFPFGTLKTIASDLNEKNIWPLFLIFDVVLLNDQSLINYPLKERKKTLEFIINPNKSHFEILPYVTASSALEIEKNLSTVIFEQSEGLVIKYPNSDYKINTRGDYWIKVKPEFVDGLSENLDLIILGGYYGKGQRNGKQLVSFLCGIRDYKDNNNNNNNNNQNASSASASVSVGDKRTSSGEVKIKKENSDLIPPKIECESVDNSNLIPDNFIFKSFAKIGGGFTKSDYLFINDKLSSKWINFKSKKDPELLKYIDVGDKLSKADEPEVWIKPVDSLVIEVKASQIVPTTSYSTKWTIRFPRFKGFRNDKDWSNCLNSNELDDLQKNFYKMEVKNEEDNKFLKNSIVDEDESKMKKKRRTIRSRPTLKEMFVLETSKINIYDVDKWGPKTNILQRNYFHVMTGMKTENSDHLKLSKVDLESIIKHHGGNIRQSLQLTEEEKHSKSFIFIKIADKETIRTQALIKSYNICDDNDNNFFIIRPQWLLDSISLLRMVPFEPKHLFFADKLTTESVKLNVDRYNDSWCVKINMTELESLIENIDLDIERKEGRGESELDLTKYLSDAEIYGELGGTFVYFFTSSVNKLSLANKFRIQKAKNYIKFFNGNVSSDFNESVGIVIIVDDEIEEFEEIWSLNSKREKKAYFLKIEWIEECWKENTRVPEENFQIQISK